jgi:hypothetical protein
MGGELSFHRRDGWTVFDLVLRRARVDPAMLEAGSLVLVAE